MLVSILENRTGENITFRRFVVSGLGGIQEEQTHILTLKPGYNALPDEEAQQVPIYWGKPSIVWEGPDLTPSNPDRQILPRERIELNNIKLYLGDDLLWMYANYDDKGLISAKGGDLSKRGSMPDAGGHGKAIDMRKITFDRNDISLALVTDEELKRITIELAARG